MSDELGVEFFVEASDATGAVKESLTHYFIYRALDATSNQAIPFAVESFNGKADTYQMFSIPYLLDDSDISDLFDPALNGQDPTRWKLLRYQNGAYAEYPEQLRKIELGQGFWFNTIETDFQIKIAQATVGQVSQSSSFQMTFEPGWNQIGNPYPFSIDWQQIKDANGDAALNSLWLFESGSYVSSGVLDPWKGAFVFSDNGGTVTFPISSKAPASGRTQNRLGNNMDAESWQLPLSLQIGSIRTVSSIGMHTEASASKDRFDEIAVPRFLDFVEMTTYHPEFFAPHFSTDVIPTTDSHHWSFEIESNLEGDAELSWDHLNLAGQQAELYLVDITNQVGINMKLTGSYKFERHANHRITMMYSREGEMDPGITLLGQAYPNPFKDHVIVPVMVEADDTTVELEVFDLVGKKVKTMQRHFATKGIYDFEWRAGDETNRIEAGLLFYRIRMNGLPTQVRRMIKVN